MEAFSTKGMWWLPGYAESGKVKGELKFDPGGGSMLKLSATLKFEKIPSYRFQFQRNKPIILGEDDAGQAITLVHCSEASVPLPIGMLTYRPRYIVRGCHIEIEREEDFVFDQLTVDYYNLQIWASQGRRADSTDPVNASSNPPPVDDIQVHAGKLQVRIRRNFAQGTQPATDSAKRYALIDFLSDAPLEFEELLLNIFYFQSFLSLAMQAPTWPVLVQAPHPEEESRKISIHYAPVTGYKKTDNLRSSMMYFTLKDALPYLEQGLHNWFAKSEKLDPVLQMYNSAISRRRMFINERFMLFAHAVEVYHRQMYDGTYMDEMKFNKIKEKLKKMVKSHFRSDEDKELRKRIYENLNWANSYSLRDRFDDIRKKHQHQSGRLFKEFDSFVDDVVNTRNYLTHFVEKDKSKARLEFEDSYMMRERLRVVLEVCLLSELGLDDSEMQRIIERSIMFPPL